MSRLRRGLPTRRIGVEVSLRFPKADRNRFEPNASLYDFDVVHSSFITDVDTLIR